MKPRLARALLVFAGLVAVLAASLTTPPTPVVEITYVYTTDAPDLLQPLITEFNDAGIEAGGNRVRVKPLAEEGVSSGSALRQIEDGNMKPVVWTPASSLWVRQLDGAPAGALASKTSVVQSPQVVATFDRGLGARSGNTLERVLDLAERGEIKLGHTDPNLSTSGLSAVLAEFSIAAGKDPEDLSEDDIADQAVRERVGGWEASIAHYVDIADDFKKQWCDQGRLFADAAYIQETTFLRFNEGCVNDQLHRIDPKDVRLVADYPFVVLDAGWVSPREQQAADAFGEWLDERLSGDGCKDVADAKFQRAGCPSVLPRPPGPPDEPPSGDVLTGVQLAWDDLRRAANVIVVVDESQDMAPADRLPLLRESLLDGAGARPFVDCPGPREAVGLVVFGGDEEPADALTAGMYDDAQKHALEAEIESLAPGRGKAVLRDAVWQALQKLRGLDPDAIRISTIVLLTYGVDGGSTITQDALNDALRKSPVQIIAVPYNNDAKSLQPMIDSVTKKSVGRVHDFENEEWTDVAGVSKFDCAFF